MHRWIASAAGAEDIHVQILAQIARAMAKSANRLRLADAPNAPALCAALQAVLAPPPPAN